MSKLAQLQQQRAAKITQQQTLIDERNTAEERSFTTEQEASFKALENEIRGLDSQIEMEKSIIEAEKRNASLAGVHTGGNSSEQKEKDAILKRFDIKKALKAQIRKSAIDGVEAEVNQMGMAELRSQGLDVPEMGINLPSEMMFRADSHTVTQDSGNFGGTLVKEDAGMVLPTFVNRLSIQELGVDVKSGLVGDYPLHSGNEFTFQNVDETAPLTATKAEYAKRVLKPKRTGMLAKISNQLLAQSSINVESDIRQRISTALNNRLLLDLINGDGTGANPLGLLNDATFVSALAEGPLTLQKILELEGAIDDADSTYGNNTFLMAKKLAAFAKGIKVDEGSGVFLMDMQNKLYGADTFKTSLVPVLSGAADNYPLIYGDFSSVVAGFWGGMNVLANPYSSAASNELELIINVHRDIKASNPKAFAVNKAITLS